MAYKPVRVSTRHSSNVSIVRPVSGLLPSVVLANMALLSKRPSVGRATAPSAKRGR